MTTVGDSVGFRRGRTRLALVSHLKYSFNGSTFGRGVKGKRAKKGGSKANRLKTGRNSMSQVPDFSAENPYAAPLQPGSSAALAPVQYRSQWAVIGLSIVTLFLGYPIYLVYQWSRELNGLHRQVRHSPGAVLALSIVTLGLASVIYECLFAHEISEQLRLRGHKQPLAHLTAWVIGLNAIAALFALTGIGVIVAIPCGLAATCLVQAEFNKLANRPEI
jgi:hypothetical protein